MSLIQAQPWELRLLHAAQEAFRSQARAQTLADSPALRAAYSCCESITYRHSRTFYLDGKHIPTPNCQRQNSFHPRPADHQSHRQTSHVAGRRVMAFRIQHRGQA